MDRELVIFSGRASHDFTFQTCNNLQVELGKLEVVKFSDGELSVEIGNNVRGRDVFIVQSTSNPANEHLMELLIVIDALKRASAWRITAVIPYFGYARQDRKVKPRVPITAKLVADLLTAAGAHRLLTMDLHSGQIMGFFDIPVDNLNALPVLQPYIKKQYGDKNLTFVSPDAGGVNRVRDFASHFPESQIAIIDKRRSGPNQVSEMNVIGDVKNRTCIIIDDMIDTGGTLVKAGNLLIEQGAGEVIACCVHPVLSGQAIERINESPFKELVVTDSIKVPNANKCKKLKIISVTDLFSSAISRIHNEDSITSLFK